MMFKPVRTDGRSYRTVACDAFKELEVGGMLTYKQLGDLLGFSPIRERGRIQQAVLAANKLLLKIHKRGVVNVPDTGYRVIEAKEHMNVATEHQSKAERQMVRALDFFAGADLSQMSDTERKLHHGLQMTAQAIYASHQHLAKRIQRIEDILEGTKTINNADVDEH